MMSFQEMYEDYIKHKNAEVMMTGWGFVQYEIHEQSVYITNLYLMPEFRKAEINADHPFIKTVEKVKEMAKAKGCGVLCNIVEDSNPKKERLIQYHEWYGMKQVPSPNGEDIIMYMEI